MASCLDVPLLVDAETMSRIADAGDETAALAGETDSVQAGALYVPPSGVSVTILSSSSAAARRNTEAHAARTTVRAQPDANAEATSAESLQEQPIAVPCVAEQRAAADEIAASADTHPVAVDAADVSATTASCVVVDSAPVDASEQIVEAGDEEAVRSDPDAAAGMGVPFAVAFVEPFADVRLRDLFFLPRRSAKAVDVVAPDVEGQCNALAVSAEPAAAVCPAPVVSGPVVSGAHDAPRQSAAHDDAAVPLVAVSVEASEASRVEHSSAAAPGAGPASGNVSLQHDGAVPIVAPKPADLIASTTNCNAPYCWHLFCFPCAVDGVYKAANDPGFIPLSVTCQAAIISCLPPLWPLFTCWHAYVLREKFGLYLDIPGNYWVMYCVVCNPCGVTASVHREVELQGVEVWIDDTPCTQLQRPYAHQGPAIASMVHLPLGREPPKVSCLCFKVSLNSCGHFCSLVIGCVKDSFSAVVMTILYFLYGVLYVTGGCLALFVSLLGG